MGLSIKQFLGVPVGIALAFIAFYVVREVNPNLFMFLCVLAFIFTIIPFVLAFLGSRKRQKEKEGRFLEFTRDLVEGVKSGTPVNKAIINLQNRDYGALSPHIKKLANQIYLGINLEKAFTTFAKDTKSKVVSRSVSLISEAQRAGGKIETILQSVAGSVNQIRDLEKERLSSVYNLIIQGYIIFLVFIVIMLVLEYAILPLAVEFSQNQVEGLTGQIGSSEPISQEDFSNPLFFMLLVQSLFAGIVVGKISEGSVLGGIKHSFLLTTLTLLIVTGTRAILG